MPPAISGNANRWSASPPDRQPYATFDEDFSGTAEPDCGRFGADRLSREPEQDEPILPKRNAVIGMADDLEREAAAPTCVFECFGRKLPDWQPAEDEWASTERDILIVFLAPGANDFDLFCFFDRRNRGGRLEEAVVKKLSGTRAHMFQHGRGALMLYRRERGYLRYRADNLDGFA